MQEFDHIPIEVLSFSKRTYHALARGGVLTVGNLRDFYLNRDKYHVRNIGEKSLDEISKALEELPNNSYVLALIEKEPAQLSFNENIWIAKTSKSSIDVLNLPAAIRGMLKIHGIQTVNDLRKAPDAMLLNINLIGPKKLAEIRHLLVEFVDNTSKPIIEKPILVEKKTITWAQIIEDYFRNEKEEAQRMADILNEDFENLMIDLEVSRRITGKTKSKINEAISSQGEIIPGDGDQNSKWQQSGQPHGDGHRGKNPPGEGDLPREGPSLIPGDEKGSKKESSESGSKRRSGLFSIEFVNSTRDDQRSHYKRAEHKILINLDHPQIALALKEGGGAQDSRQFLAMVYEVAVVEYAQAIQFEKIDQGEQIDAAEALFAVGDTINRVIRRFAEVLQG